MTIQVTLQPQPSTRSFSLRIVPSESMAAVFLLSLEILGPKPQTPHCLKSGPKQLPIPLWGFPIIITIVPQNPILIPKAPILRLNLTRSAKGPYIAYITPQPHRECHTDAEVLQPSSPPLLCWWFVRILSAWGCRDYPKGPKDPIIRYLGFG